MTRKHTVRSRHNVQPPLPPRSKPKLDKTRDDEAVVTDFILTLAPLAVVPDMTHRYAECGIAALWIQEFKYFLDQSCKRAHARKGRGRRDRDTSREQSIFHYAIAV